MGHRQRHLRPPLVEGKDLDVGLRVGDDVRSICDSTSYRRRTRVGGVTADLEDVSRYGSWGSRAQMDGISMRVGRQWDIANDRFPCRIDVLWGFAGLYPEMASRHSNKGV